METLTTNGIEVSVETFYQADYSAPALHKVFFAYQIKITNHNPFSVQLISRYWHILDSTGFWREVKGDGVVGQQPVLAPGESHTYVSGCPLQTGMGRMRGHYNFIASGSNAPFQVAVPEFQMMAPFKMN